MKKERNTPNLTAERELPLTADVSVHTAWLVHCQSLPVWVFVPTCMCVHIHTDAYIFIHTCA